MLLMLLTLNSRNLYAKLQGQAQIDSMVSELAKQRDDTNKVRLLNSLSESYMNVDPEQGVKYGMSGLQLASKLGWKKGIASAYNCAASNYYQQSNYDKTLEYYFKALKINEEEGFKLYTAAVTCNIGNVYHDLGDYPKALAYLLKALALDEAGGYKQYTAQVTYNIGGIYYEQNDYAKALEYNFKALKLSEKLEDNDGIADASCCIASIYDYQKEYAKALEYGVKALRLYEQVENKGGIAYAANNIGSIYNHQHNYTEGLAYEFKALKINEALGAEHQIAINLGYIGEAYINIATDTIKRPTKVHTTEPVHMLYMPDSLIPRGKNALLHKAAEYLLRSIKIDSTIGTLDNLQYTYLNLSHVYALLGDYKGSLAAYTLHSLYKDSVYNEAKKTEIMRLGMVRKMGLDSMKNADEKRVIELKFHHQRTYTYMGIAGILLLAFFSFFIVKERRKSEEERKKSENLLLNILPGEVANELKTTGSTKAKHYDNVTVLFTDFVNFTNAGERMSPQGLIDELHTCFKAFDEITARYNIEKIKTIGDAYLAVCGLPAADPKHAEHIVAAAKEINIFMQERLAKLGNKTFDIRLGINSGSVVAGIVGARKFAYDIWGDTVNTAARMEQNSEAGKINISETTYELVKDKFKCEYRGEIEAKGKGMMKMYYVTSLSPERGPTI